MKKLVLSILFAMFVSSAFAGSCPMMANNIDAKIADLLVRVFPSNYEKIMGLEKRYKRYKNSK